MNKGYDNKTESVTMNYLVLGIVILLLAISALQSFQISAMKVSTSSYAATTTTSDSYEQMMKEMHPEQYAENQMVGGC